MAHQSKILLLRLLIVTGFTLCAGMNYVAAHWLVWDDKAYQKVFWSPYRSIALAAGFIEEHLGLGWMLAGGLLIGAYVAAIHAWRWLLLPGILLLVGFVVFILIGFL
jgi:hypothetical protein